MSDDKKAPSFKVFRIKDAPAYSETNCMELVGVTPVIQNAMERAYAEGDYEGNEVRLLFSMPGMSLTYGWFKSGFPLPLHTHNADCLYYIIAGTLKLGSEILGPGDGFFVGCDVPYTYKPGPEGVEVLEFRTADQFDICFKGKTEAFWDRIIEGLRTERPGWKDQARPSGMTLAKEA